MKLFTDVVIVVVLSTVIGTAYHMWREPKMKIPFIGTNKCNFDRARAKSRDKPDAPRPTPTPETTPTDPVQPPVVPVVPVVPDQPDTAKIPDPPVVPDTPEPPAEEDLGEFEISLASAFDDYFKDGLAIFVDARRGKHFEPGHVPGARSLSPWEGDFEERLEAFMNAEAESGRPVVIYCTGGDCEDSHSVADRLRGAGFEEVVILRVGFPAWKKAGHPVETGPEKTDH